MLVFLSFFSKGQPIPKETKIASDHVRIDHVGPKDKPFESIVVTASHLDLEPEEMEALVSQSVFLIVTNEVEKNMPVNTVPKERVFGMFKIVVLLRGEERNYFLPTRASAIQFFRNLKIKVNTQQGSRELIRRLDYILFRIKA